MSAQYRIRYEDKIAAKFKSRVPKMETGRNISRKDTLAFVELGNGNIDMLIPVFTFVEGTLADIFAGGMKEKLDPEIFGCVKDKLIKNRWKFFDESSSYPGMDQASKFVEDKIVSLLAEAFQEALGPYWTVRRLEIPLPETKDPDDPDKPERYYDDPPESEVYVVESEDPEKRRKIRRANRQSAKASVRKLNRVAKETYKSDSMRLELAKTLLSNPDLWKRRNIKKLAKLVGRDIDSVKSDKYYIRTKFNNKFSLQRANGRIIMVPREYTIPRQL